MRSKPVHKLASVLLAMAFVSPLALPGVAGALPCLRCDIEPTVPEPQPEPEPEPEPQPVACGSQRVIVRMTNVDARETEDLWWPGDELYLVGGGRATNGEFDVMLTTPLQIGWGQTRTVPLSQNVLFDATVRPSDSVTIAFEAFDEDFSKDWSKRPQVMDDIAKALAAGLITLGPAGIAGAAAFGAAYFFMGYVDPDDLLANQGFTLPACGPAHETGSRTFSSGLGTWWSSWDYTVHYEVIRLPA